jgi:sialic acid synthase SpsE
MIEKLEFAYKDHLEIINFCKREKIDFISTPYDAESAKLLNILKVKKQILKTYF